MDMTYKKGTYVAFMTKQPEVHVNEMFGHNDLGPDDFEKTEHIGYVRTVIDNNTFVINARGFYCTVDRSDILRLANEDEIPKEESERSMFQYDQGPNVYVCQRPPSGKSVPEKCENAAREAMKQLFPEDDIEFLKFVFSYYKKSDLQENMKMYLSCMGMANLDEKANDAYNYFVEVLRTKRFKEYYTVIVKVNKGVTNKLLYYVAIDMNMEEIIIMRNNEEKMCFMRSLGPEYDAVDRVRRGIIYTFKSNDEK